MATIGSVSGAYSVLVMYTVEGDAMDGELLVWQKPVILIPGYTNEGCIPGILAAGLDKPISDIKVLGMMPPDSPEVAPPVMRLPKWLGKKRAGDARTEEQRRSRVVHGWAFRGLPEEESAAIKAYLNGGPVPPGYEHLDSSVR